MKALSLINKNYNSESKTYMGAVSYGSSDIKGFDSDNESSAPPVKKRKEDKKALEHSNPKVKIKSRKRKAFDTFVYYFFTIIITASLVIGYLYYKNNSGSTEIESVALNPDTNISTLGFVDLIVAEPKQYLLEKSPDVISLDSTSYLAFNPVSGQTFEKSNEDIKRPIASITKLITALILIDKYDYNGELTVKADIAPEVEGMLDMKAGDIISTEDALNAMLIGSYNDAAYVVAQNYPDGGYDGFIKEMNRVAEYLGMYDSKFSNPAGLDSPDNYSTAADVRKLAEFALKDELIRDIILKGADDIVVSRVDGQVTRKRAYTTNFLLSTDSRTRGLKTGYTSDAGGCFVGYFVDSAGNELVTIILGVSEEGNRFDETAKFLRDLNERYF